MPYPYYPQTTGPAPAYPVGNYQPPQNLYQPPQPQNVYPQLRGRVINDINEVTAQEVPMDGVGSVFIKSDRSEIFTKNWRSDGTIQTDRYVHDTTKDSASFENNPNLADIMDMIADLKSRIARLEQSNIDRKRARMRREEQSDDA